MKNKQLIAHLMMLITSFLAATSFPIAGLITKDLPPVILMFARFLLAAILFAPYVIKTNGLQLPEFSKLRLYSILSIFLVTFFWCMFESLRYTSVLNTGALYTLVPAFTAVFALFINRIKTSKGHSMALLIGTIGALWIVFKGDYVAFFSMSINYGDYVFLIGALSLSIYNTLIKKFYSGEPMQVMTFWVLISGTLWLLLASKGAVFEVNWLGLAPRVYAGLLYLSFFTTLITFFLLQLSVIEIGPTKVAAYSFLTPVFITIINFFAGLAEFEMASIPGILLVLIAMILMLRK
ncbi:MAG: DMT family transporter [Candidatus Cloacimonetes bacterium]|nr:DMT family transporter [Candidatus Cloacimonadota bacterium]